MALVSNTSAAEHKTWLCCQTCVCRFVSTNIISSWAQWWNIQTLKSQEEFVFPTFHLWMLHWSCKYENDFNMRLIWDTTMSYSYVVVVILDHSSSSCALKTKMDFKGYWGYANLPVNEKDRYLWNNLEVFIYFFSYWKCNFIFVKPRLSAVMLHRLLLHISQETKIISSFRVIVLIQFSHR